MNISIVIFCYNERDSIREVIDASFNLASQISKDYEIIVVDDGSTDGSVDILMVDERVRLIRHQANRGIGAALRSGYAVATKEFICAIPGDGQFDVNELQHIKPFGINRILSFYRPRTHYNFYRSALTVFNKIFNRFFLGINMKDVNWIKVYRRDQIAFVEMEMNSSIVESEICAKLVKAGCIVSEIPSIYHDRIGGVSTGGSWKTLNKALKEMYSLYRAVNRFHKQLPIS